MVSKPPKAEVTDKPAEVLDRAGSWLAGELGRFHWVASRHDLRRRTDGTEVCFTLEASKWNRAGVGTWVSPRLTVSDDVHQEWLRRQTGQRAASKPTAYNTLLVNVESQFSSVECSGLPQSPELQRGSCGLDAFLRGMQATLLPTCELFSKPSRAATHLPESWLSMVSVGTVEWALAHNDRTAATVFVRRHMERALKGQQTWESRVAVFRQGWASEDAPQVHLGADSLGWISRRYDLIAPDDLRPAAPATEAPRPASTSPRSSPRLWFGDRRPKQ